MRFGQAGYKSKTIEYARPSGKTLATIYYPNVESRGLSVVFCHGTGNDRFYPQFDLFHEFLKIGCEVFTFDLDGHGKNSTTLLSRYEIDTCVQAALMQCVAELKPKKILLVGHSLGAVLALLAESDPNVAGVVAISPPVHLPLKRGTVRSEVLGIFKAHAFRQIFNYGLIGSLPSAGSFRRNALPIRLKDSTAGKTGFYYVKEINAIVEQANMENVLKSAGKPRLIVTGDRDSIAPAEMIEKNLVSDARTKYVKFEGENHVSLIFSPKCLKIITEFAKGLTDGSRN